MLQNVRKLHFKYCLVNWLTKNKADNCYISIPICSVIVRYIGIVKFCLEGSHFVEMLFIYMKDSIVVTTTSSCSIWPRLSPIHRVKFIILFFMKILCMQILSLKSPSARWTPYHPPKLIMSIGIKAAVVCPDRSLQKRNFCVSTFNFFLNLFESNFLRYKETR